MPVYGHISFLLHDIYVIDVKVHRRTVAYGGPGEALNELGIDGKGLIIRGRHLVVLDTVENSTVFHRALGEMMMMREFPLFMADSSTPSDFMKKYNTNVSN